MFQVGGTWSPMDTGNLITNICGAFTTCSIYDHVLRLEKKRDRKTLDMSLIQSALQLCLNAAFLNAVNYMQYEWSAANIANAVHLFLVVCVGFYNALILLVYITDDSVLDISPKQLYPYSAFVWGFFFLLSYCWFIVFPPDETSSEWILFLFDCGTFLIAVWYVLYCIYYYTRGEYEEYPWIALIFFTIVILGIDFAILCYAVPSYPIDPGNCERQFKSGIAILLGAFFAIILVNRRLRKRVKD